MIRHILYLALSAWIGAATAPAQELTAIARVDRDRSGVFDGWFGGSEIVLHLTQGVPFRVFTMDGPPRLVIDFREADWSGVRAGDLLAETDALSDLRFGNFRPGWSRLVADLSKPMLPEEIGMAIDEGSGRAVLRVKLGKTNSSCPLAQ